MRLAKALIPLLATLALPGMAAAQHLDNPFVGAKMYVNPDYSANANAEAAKQSGDLAARMRLVGQQPTAVWMDRIAAVPSLATHLDQTLSQGANLFLGVVYDLPGRDCAALASNGELPGTAEGLARYKAEYIDAIDAIVSQSKYAGIRIVFVVESDSLPNLVTNLSDAECSQMNSSGIYVQGIQYALNRLRAHSNVYAYIDIAHSGWLGWTSNSGPFVTFINDKLVPGLTQGRAAIDGWVANTANTLPTKEPFISGSQSINGQQVISAKFYEYNPMVDESSYAADMYSRFVSSGFSAGTGIILDTSRNGWGGTARPRAPSTSTDVTTYVNASKIDRRAHRGLWCNPDGSGIGEIPQAAPSGWSAQHFDAFVWVKPPAESDGSSSLIPNDQGKGFDRMCDPTYMTSYGVLTGALSDAPISGQWFPKQFVQLVTNMYPIPGAPAECQAVPPSPTNLTATQVSGSEIRLTWTGITFPPNCTGSEYRIYRSTQNPVAITDANRVAGTVSGSPFVVGGLTPNTTYFFVVRAVNELGGTSSNQVQMNTPNGYTLSVTKSGTGAAGGTVSGGGINCGSQCSVVTNPGTMVTLTATVASGTSFTNWSGDCTGTTTTCVVNMSQSRSVGAVFGGVAQNVTLTVSKGGTGTGTVTGTSGINCGSTCTASVPVGTVVTLTASATSPSTFGGWSGGGCTGTAATCAVTMSAATTVTATFTANTTNRTLTVQKAGTGTGTVTSSTGGINCGATCNSASAVFTSGAVVTLTASAGSNSTFAGWSAPCSGTGTCVVTLSADQTVTATFNPQGQGTGPVAANGMLRRCNNRICNANNVAVQFRGMSWFWSNTTWGAERFYNAQAVQNLATTWGAGIVRAAIGVHGGGGYFSGDSVTPADPAGNMARARALIDGAIAAGVYVIVDWHSHELHQAEAQAFFQQLAQAYPNTPNIIWETFNEPPGTTYSWAQLKAYHQAVIQTIRAAGSQNLVIVGSPNWSQDVDVATNDPVVDSLNNVGYTLHFYAGSHTQWLRDKGNTAMSRGWPIMVTEYGTCDASGDGGYNEAETTNWFNWMDQNLISSANWSMHDKLETASALQNRLTNPVSATGPWNDTSDLTQSGRFVKAYIQRGQVQTFALTVTTGGTGTGMVTSSTGGISCGTVCTANYTSGAVVTLTAAATSPSTFGGWSGGVCSGTATTCVVTMSAARSVTATFNPGVNTFALTVTKAGTGAGTVTSNPAGISCGAACSANFTANSSVTLTAAPTSPSTFGGWSGGVCSGTATTCVVSMSAARSVTATFNGVSQFALSVTLGGTGTGNVSSSPAGINCGTTCSANFAANSSVTLAATPGIGSTFGSWSGGVCSGSATTCVVTMSAARSVTANFTQVNQNTFTVTAVSVGSGTVSSTPAGLNCGATCSAQFADGTDVTLVATPAAGAAFLGWGDGDCTGDGEANLCVIPGYAGDTLSVTANFSSVNQPVPLTVTKSGTGTGTVSSSPAGIACGATCSATYTTGTLVTLTATPTSPSTFGGWSGACTGTTATCVVTMSAAQTVNALFNPGTSQFLLSVTKAGTGSGTVTSSPAGINCGSTCSANFAANSSVTLTATPSGTSTFTSWSGCNTATGTTCVVTMNAAKSVTATFGPGGTTPCANPRDLPSSGQSGNFGTTGAVCYRTNLRVAGWGCSNIGGRTVSVNGGTATSSCGGGPLPLAKMADGYTYFSFTAGTVDYASMYFWQ